MKYTKKKRKSARDRAKREREKRRHRDIVPEWGARREMRGKRSSSLEKGLSTKRESLRVVPGGPASGRNGAAAKAPRNYPPVNTYLIKIGTF